MAESTGGSQAPSDPKAAHSWVSRAQNKQVLKKYEVAISTSEGQTSVEIPEGIIENATPLWEDFLIGKFLDTAPHVAKVHVILNKIWKNGAESQQIDVYAVDSITMRFRVRNPFVRARILKRGMWSIAEVPMVVSKWSPLTEKDKPEEKSIPLWVHLKKVPMHMYSWEGLSFITSAVGHPVRLHPETAACSNFDVAKIFVKADLSKKLPKQILFSKNGEEFLVDFMYPWLPPRCSLCEKWGHLNSRCAMNGKNSETKDEEEVIDRVTKNKAEEFITVPTLEPESRPEEENQIIKKIEDLEEKAAASAVVTNEEHSEQWSTVSPSKTGRSPQRNSSLSENAIPIASASQFAVLSDLEEEGEITERDTPAVDSAVTEAGEKEVPQEETQTAEKPITKDASAKSMFQTEAKNISSGVVDQERPLLPRTSKNKQKDTSENSNQVTKNTNLVTSGKRFSKRHR